jgi:uncharacterized membrane protein YoaK (UPF0700 family)
MVNEAKISFALSFVSGFIDTAGFIALFGLFTAHVTGNLVLAGAAFFDSGQYSNLTGKLLMLPVFISAVAFTSYLIKYKKATVVKLVLLEALFIACFSIAGACLLHNQAEHSGTVNAITASLAVTGMAIQNTYMRKLLSSYIPNTVMTGNFTQFSIEIFNVVGFYFLKSKNKNLSELKSMLSSLRKVAIVLTGFLVGCVLGAFLVKIMGLVCCLLPAILLLWVKFKIGQPN